MMTKEAMKLALDALIVCRQSNYGRNWCWPDTAIKTALNNVFEAIEALEEALKQEQGEPVAWDDLLKDAQQIVKDKFLYKRFIDGTPLANDIPCWMADFAQQYTTPQTKEWVGLTEDDDIDWEEGGTLRDLVKEIEAKLKEKNG